MGAKMHGKNREIVNIQVPWISPNKGKNGRFHLVAPSLSMVADYKDGEVVVSFKENPKE